MIPHDTEQRYSRHLSLDGIGKAGQAQLEKTKVLVIGVGGLGCPLSLYLAASGIGIIGLIDHDRVSLSNLNRQILFETADIGRFKVEAAQDRLEEFNPDTTLNLYPQKLDASNARELIEAYDIIADGSDNPDTRMLVNATCHQLGKPLISAAIHGWEGQLYRFHTAKDSACYQCLYPDPPTTQEMPSCAESGVFSPLAGMMGSWQAAEAVKTALGIGDCSQMQRIDLRDGMVKSSKLTRDTRCIICSS